MKSGIILTIVMSVAVCANAQSARVKPSPTPNDQPRINGTYLPTQEVVKPRPVMSSATTDDSSDVFTVDSTLVPIPAYVLDENGRTISNLNLADFDLKVDGREVEIGALSRSETPLRLALLFDNSTSVLIARDFEKSAAIKFFRRVIRPKQDVASLYSISSVSRLEQPFTPDVSLLTRAIESFPLPVGATALLDGIYKAAVDLREVSGRRVIVIVSDGDDTASETSLEATMREVQLTGALVYVVKTTDFENFQRTRSRAGNANLRQLAAERRMQEIARQTGGAVFSPLDEDELENAFNQISAELSGQYTLSYYPDDDRQRPGEFRNITLTIKERPNFAVRTRKGYYVPRRRAN